MSRIAKRIIAATAILLVGSIICTTLYCNRLTAEAEGYSTLPGIETINNKNNSNNPFVIIEVVADKNDARFGYLISGEEPIKNGKALNDLPSKEERTEAMNAFVSSAQNDDVNALIADGAFSLAGGYYEVTDASSSTGSTFLSGYFAYDPNGNYVHKTSSELYRLYDVSKDDAGIQRFSKYLDADFEGDNSVTLSFSYIESAADKNIIYNGENYRIYYSYNIPSQNGIVYLDTVGTDERGRLNLSEKKDLRVYTVTSKASGAKVYNYYGTFRKESDGFGQYIRTIDGEYFDINYLAKDKYAFVTFEESEMGGDYVIADVADVSGNNEGNFGGFGINVHYEPNDSGEYVLNQDTVNVFEYVPLDQREDYIAHQDNSNFYYESYYKYVPTYSNTGTGEKVYYVNGIVNNADWFKTKVMDVPTSELSSFYIDLRTMTMEEFNAASNLDADLVYFAGGDYSTLVKDEKKQEVLDAVNSRKLPVVIEKSFANQGGNNASLLSELSLAGISSGSYVNNSVYVYDDSVESFYSGFCRKIDAPSGYSVDNDNVAWGYSEVYKEIELENKLRSVAKENILVNSGVSKATALRYIINNAGQRITTKKEISVLEIEPCYSFNRYYSEDELKQVYTSGQSSGKVDELQHEILDTTRISKWINQTSKQDVTTKLTQTYTKEFIGKIEDLNTEYDLIYIGLDTTTMNTEVSSISGNKKLKTNVTLYNDPNLKGIIYSHYGDKLQASDGILSWEEGYSSLIDNSYRMSGNDITLEKFNDLTDYIKAGYALVLDDNFFSYDKDGNITGVNANVTLGKNNVQKFTTGYRKVSDGEIYAGNYGCDSEEIYEETNGDGNYDLISVTTYKYNKLQYGNYSVDKESYVGDGEGDYRREKNSSYGTDYHYVYAGIGKGDYKVTFKKGWGYYYPDSAKEYVLNANGTGQYKLMTKDKPETMKYVGYGNGNYVKYYSRGGSENGVLGENSYMAQLAAFVLGSTGNVENPNERYIDRNVFIRSDIEGNNSKVVNNFKTYLNLSKLNITVLEKPVEYSNPKDKNGVYHPVYNSSDTFRFSVELKNDAAIGLDSTTYDVHLYLDLNADGRYSEKDEDLAENIYVTNKSLGRLENPSERSIVDKEGNLTGKSEKFYSLKAGYTYVIEMKVQSGYVGMLPWKLEFTQNPKQDLSQVSSASQRLRLLEESRLVRKSITGYTAIQVPSNTRETIKVLQITGSKYNSNDRYYNNAELKNTLDLEHDSGVQDQVAKVQDFNIIIKTITAQDLIDVSEVVSENCTKYDDEGKEIVLKKLVMSGSVATQAEYYDYLKQYDMLILGFSDIYDFTGDKNSSHLNQRNQNAANALAQYIESGCSVLFTHDTTSRFNFDYLDINNNNKFDGSNYSKETYIWGYAFNKYVRTVVGMDRYNVLGGSTVYDYLAKPGDTTADNATGSRELLSHGYTDLEIDSRYGGKNSNNYYNTSRNAAKHNSVTYYDGKYPNNDDYYITQVNSGQITEYPFNLDLKEGEKLPIALTHYQYYQLNLDTNSKDDIDNDDIVVWYCISDVQGNSLDDVYQMNPNDVRNTYYIYTKGNVTYSGVGNSPINTDEKKGDVRELQLFINTMVAAYRAGVHPPAIIYHDADSNVPIDTVYVPYDSNFYIQDDEKNTGFIDKSDNVVLYFEITDSSFTLGTKWLEHKIEITKYSYDEENGKLKKSTAPLTDAEIYEKDLITTAPDILSPNKTYALVIDKADLALAGNVVPYVSINIGARTWYSKGGATSSSEWGEYALQIRRVDLFDLE